VVLVDVLEEGEETLEDRLVRLQELLVVLLQPRVTVDLLLKELRRLQVAEVEEVVALALLELWWCGKIGGVVWRRGGLDRVREYRCFWRFQASSRTLYPGTISPRPKAR
jgi:hypothetical protein